MCRWHADVAQLVAHHLAKVRVAGSNPVVRSRRRLGRRVGPARESGGLAEWLRQGPAKPCTRVRFPHPPRAIGAVGARFLDTEEVTGSNPVSPTKKHQVEGLIAETAIKPLIVCHLGVIGTACHQVFKSVTGRQLLIFD